MKFCTWKLCATERIAASTRRFGVGEELERSVCSHRVPDEDRVLADESEHVVQVVDVGEVARDVDVVLGRHGDLTLEIVPSTKTSPLRHPYDGFVAEVDGGSSPAAG